MKLETDGTVKWLHVSSEGGPWNNGWHSRSFVQCLVEGVLFGVCFFFWLVGFSFWLVFLCLIFPFFFFSLEIQRLCKFVCYLRAHCKPIMLQNQHRTDHGDALVSFPKSCISFFKPFQLFYYLNYGRAESIVENKHGERMLIQGLFCFLYSHRVTFQNCYVRLHLLPPVLIIFFQQQFWVFLIVALQLAQQWEEGIKHIHVTSWASNSGKSVFRSQVRHCSGAGCARKAAEFSTHASLPLHHVGSELRHLELVRLLADRGAQKSSSSNSCAWPACLAADVLATSGTGSKFR